MSFKNHKIGKAIAAAAIGVMALAPVSTAHGRYEVSAVQHASAASIDNATTVREAPNVLQPSETAGSGAETQDSSQSQDGSALNGIGGPSNTVDYTGFSSGMTACQERSSCSVPVGLASYAYEYGNSPQPYPFSTNALMGIANISQLGAQSYVQSEDGSGQELPLGNNGPTNGASLQLNAILSIGTSSGELYYWVQDVAKFDTNDSTVGISSEIWNSSPPNSPASNATLSSQGCGGYNVSMTILSGGGCWLEQNSYSLPLGLDLSMSAQYSGNQVTISFNYYTGSTDANVGAVPAETQFSQIVISVPGIDSASFNSSLSTFPPNLTIPMGVEFVWGGFGNSLGSHFSSMNSTMYLYYEGARGCCLASTPEIWRQLVANQNYGVDTAEATDNLTSVPSGSGVNVTVGTPNPGHLEVQHLLQPLVRGSG